MLLLAVSSSFAATNWYVLLGDDFQQKIDLAAPGDTLVVQEGAYTNNLTFSKPVTVLRTGTNNDLIRLYGNVQIRSTGAVSFAQSVFYTSLPIYCTGTVSFAQCQFLAPVTSQGANILLAQVACSNTFDVNLSSATGTNMQVYDSVFSQAASLTVTGGKVLFKRCTLWGYVTLSTNAGFEALRITTYYPITATAAGSGASFIAVQSSFLNYPLILSGYKVWFGYNSNYSISYNPMQLIDCDTVLIGNRFLGAGGAGGQGAIQVLRGSLKAYNNLIVVASTSGSLGALHLNSTSAEIVNNTISETTLAYGIRVSGTGGPITLRGNIIRPAGGNFAVSSAGPTLLVSYCDILGGGGVWNEVSGTPPCLDCIVADPQFASDYSLQAGSPCIGKGSPEAIYNNRGTTNRNDMGYTGGPYWNPANYTNDNPMVFMLTGRPLTIFKGPGGRTNILVNTAASSGH